MPDKWSSYRQYLVKVFVMDDTEVNPDASVSNALAQVWGEYGNSEGRFRVTRAEARTAQFDEFEDEADQLVFVCDYVAKGANAHDARKKISRIIAATGITILGIEAVEIASLRAEEPFAVVIDLPSCEELHRRANL